AAASVRSQSIREAADQGAEEQPPHVRHGTAKLSGACNGDYRKHPDRKGILRAVRSGAPGIDPKYSRSKKCLADDSPRRRDGASSCVSRSHRSVLAASKPLGGIIACRPSCCHRTSESEPHELWMQKQPVSASSSNTTPEGAFLEWGPTTIG